MDKLDFVKLLLDHFPWAQSPEMKAFIAKATISLNLSDPIDRAEAFECDVCDFFRLWLIALIRQCSSSFADVEGCINSVQLATEMKKQQIHAFADYLRNQVLR